MKALVLLILCLNIHAQSLYYKGYDQRIKQAVGVYWSDYPFYKSLKAQLYQESLLEIGAKSNAGAMGIAQFMPKTWFDMQKKLNMPKWATPYLPNYAIKASAYYMRTLRNAWSSKRLIRQKHKLAVASYNAGLGNILKAQKECKRLKKAYHLWDDIKACLPYITGRHSKETISYVDKVELWEKKLNEY